MTRTAMALFTRDLRVHDNPTLQAAVDAPIAFGPQEDAMLAGDPTMAH